MGGKLETGNLKPEMALAEANRTMDAMLVKICEQAMDVAFLVERCGSAGSVGFGGSDAGRDTGMSSNSIVAIAYGAPLDEQVFPSDQSDLDACVRAFEKLPAHRKTRDAHEAMFRATQFLSVKQREFGRVGVDAASIGQGGRS